MEQIRFISTLETQAGGTGTKSHRTGRALQRRFVRLERHSEYEGLRQTSRFALFPPRITACSIRHPSKTQLLSIVLRKAGEALAASVAS